MKNGMMNRIMAGISAPFQSFARQRKLNQERAEMKKAKSVRKEQHHIRRKTAHRKISLRRFFGATDKGKKHNIRFPGNIEVMARYIKAHPWMKKKVDTHA